MENKLLKFELMELIAKMQNLPPNQQVLVKQNQLENLLNQNQKKLVLEEEEKKDQELQVIDHQELIDLQDPIEEEIDLLMLSIEEIATTIIINKEEIPVGILPVLVT